MVAYRSPPTGRQVTRLEYEAYVPLALKAMVSILEEARNLPPPPPLEGSHPCCPPPSSNLSITPTSQTTRQPLHDPHDATSELTPGDIPKIEINRIYLSHLLGPSPPLNPSIVISVASPHRREAFWLTEWLLERVKERVPVWKREYYADADEAFIGRDGEGIEGRGGRSRDGSGGEGETEEGRWKENFKAEKVVRIEKLP